MTEPTALAQLRHLYKNMVNGAVRDTASAKRIAEGLLAPAIEALERGTPPAVAGEPVAWLSTDSIGERYLCFTKPNDSDPARPLVFGDTTPQPTQAQAGAVPLTDEQIKALTQARSTAMQMAAEGRIPECGDFAAIAQNLDWLCDSFGSSNYTVNTARKLFLRPRHQAPPDPRLRLVVCPK